MFTDYDCKAGKNMKPVLLIDFGSTYTKVTAADVDECRLLGTANAYTTVQSDINNGLSDALSKLEKVTGKLDFANATPPAARRAVFVCLQAGSFRN